LAHTHRNVNQHARYFRALDPSQPKPRYQIEEHRPDGTDKWETEQLKKKQRAVRQQAKKVIALEIANLS
jgi:hypothetical protein